MTLEELKAQRDELNQKIRELESAALEELQERAAQFGLELVQAQPKKERRKRRTKEEMAEFRASMQ